MIKKKIIIIIISLFLTTGCYSKDNKELAKKYREQGELNAISYVKEKYNIDAKIKSVVEESECNNVWGCLISTPTGDVVVKFNINNKDFNVYITGEYETNEGLDDYQLDEIEKDLISYFKNNIELNLYDYSIEYKLKGVKEYYNNNLDTFIPYITKVELNYIGKYNLNELKLNNIEQKFNNYQVLIDINEFIDEEKYMEYKRYI